MRPAAHRPTAASGCCWRRAGRWLASRGPGRRELDAWQQSQRVLQVDHARVSERGAIQHRNVAYRGVDVFRYPRGGDDDAIELALRLLDRLCRRRRQVLLRTRALPHSKRERPCGRVMPVGATCRDGCEEMIAFCMMVLTSRALRPAKLGGPADEGVGNTGQAIVGDGACARHRASPHSGQSAVA